MKSVPCSQSLVKEGKLKEEIVTLPFYGLYYFLSFFAINLKIFRAARSSGAINLCVPYHIGILAAPAIILSGKPFFITEHWSGYSDNDGRFKSLTRIPKWIIRLLFRKSKKVISISEFLSKEIDRKFGTSNKTIIIPNVLNCNQQFNVERHSGFNFLCISNFDEKVKNTKGVVSAFSRICIDHPDIRLILAGDGSGRNGIISFIQSLPEIVSEKIILPGYIPNEEMNKVYMKADCYILNSVIETFSISTADALLKGIPVISTKCGGPEEYITTENGILIPINDDLALESAMRTMLINIHQYQPSLIKNKMADRYCVDTGKLISDCLF